MGGEEVEAPLKRRELEIGFKELGKSGTVLCKRVYSLSLQVGIKLHRDTSTAEDTAFLCLPRISLEDLQRAVMKCRNDEQLKRLLRDDYNLLPNFLVSCLRRGMATGNLLLLEHALKFNGMLPADSSLCVDDGVILQLLQKAVTRSEMDTFLTILRSSCISNKQSMRAELLSLVILSAQFGNGDAVVQLCKLYPTCVEQTSQGRSAFVELSGAQTTEDSLVSTLTYLLQREVNVNMQGPDGNTALHNTVTRGHITATKLLVREGACVNLPNNLGETPISLGLSSCLEGVLLPPNSPLPQQASLYLAAEQADFESLDRLAKRGHITATKLLVREGACVNLPNNLGETPISLGLSSCLEGVLLPPNSPLPQQASLYLAAEQADFESLDRLAKRVPVDSTWIHARTALSAASRKGHADMVRHLLSLGALPFPLGHVWPNLPVLHALRHGYAEVALTLVRHTTREQYARSTDVEQRHIRRQLELLLHHCAATGAVGIAQEILSSSLGVHPEVVLDKLVPMHVACRYGQLEVVKLLLSYRANATAPAEVYGNTPLHYALFYGHTHVAEYLLTLPSVHVNCTNNQQDTPLHCVLKCQLSQVEKSKFIRERSVIFLLRHGSTLQSKAKNKPSCSLEDFSLKNPGEWTLIPEATQKLIIVVRDESEPLSLMASARLAVRGGLEMEFNEDVISKLGLPYRLQRYLLLKDRFPS